MPTPFTNELRAMSKNASKLVRKLSDAETVVGGRSAEIEAIVGEEIREDVRRILLKHLRRALTINAEFNFPLLRRQLIRAFSNDEIMTLTGDKIDLRLGATIHAGSNATLMEGIHTARAELGVGVLSPEQALEFWTHRIYRPAREGLVRPTRFKKNIGRGKQQPKQKFDYVGYAKKAYRRTILARIQSWGALAPYWIWLDKGTGGYPKKGGTNFIMKAEAEATALYRKRLIDFIEQFGAAITKEIRDFLLNPQGYAPGTHLGFLETARGNYRISVTATGQLGIRRV